MREMYKINFKRTPKARTIESWVVNVANSSAIISYLKEKMAAEGFDNPKIISVEVA